MMKTWQIILFVLAMSSSQGLAENQSSTLDLATYVERYLQVSPILSQSHIVEEQRRLDKAIVDQSFTSQINIQPFISQSSIDVTPGSYEDQTRDSQIQLDLRQSLATGTQLGVRSAYSWRQSERESETNPTESLAFYLEQNLWQNFAGRQRGMRQQIAESRLQRAILEKESALLQECVAASRLYLDLFTHQQMRQLFEETAKDAADIYQRYQKLFQQRLIRETEYLTAESDLLTNKKRLLDEKQRYEQALLAFLLSIKQEASETYLQNPTVNLPEETRKLKQEEFLSLRQIRRLDLEIAESRNQLDLARDQSRSQIDLVFEAGRGKSQQIVEFGLLTSERQYVQLGIRADIPLMNRVPAFETDRAKAEVLLNEERRRASLLEAQLESERMHSRWQFLQERMDLTQKRSKVLNAKLKSARQQVDRMQMELFDYIRHRTELINSRLEEFENQRDFWNQRLESWLLMDMTPEFCRIPT
ncbi:MAG: TolC family protein [Oligoflexus sp.]